MERYLVRAWVGLCLVGMLLGIRAPLAVTATAVVLAILALVPARVKPKELTMPPLPVGLPIETREAERACALHGPQGGVVWLKVGDDTAEYCPRCYQAFLDCHLKRL